MLFDFLFRFLKNVTVIRMGIFSVDALWWIYDLNRRQSLDEYKIWSSSFKPRFTNFTKRHCCIWNVALGSRFELRMMAKVPVFVADAILNAIKWIIMQLKKFTHSTFN